MMKMERPISYKAAVSEKRSLMRCGIKCHVIESKIFNLDYLYNRNEPQWISTYMVQLL